MKTPTPEPALAGMPAPNSDLPSPNSQPSILARLKREERRIRLDHITPSKTNDRKAFDTPADADMRESIKRHGIIQSLWLRIAKDSSLSDKDPRFQLIAGERRWTNGTAAGAIDAPATIFLECSDAAARELQIIENLQREGISPIEEGRGYQQLMKTHGYTLEQLMAELSKSKSYIYGRIKLTELPKLGIEAVAAGKLSPSVAVRIARIPGPDAQKQAIADILDDSYLQTDDKAAEHIERHFMTELKGAPFDRDDASLNPDMGPCGPCQWRSGNQKDLFPEFAGKGRADICTKPECFRVKRDAAWKRRSEAHKAAGGEVLEGEKAARVRYSSAFRRLDDKCYSDDKKRTYGVLLKGLDIPVTLARDREGDILELVDAKAADAALVKSGVLKKSGAARSDGNEAWKKQQAAEAAKRKKEAAVRVAKLSALGAAMENQQNVGEQATHNWLLIVAAKLAAAADKDACRLIVKARGLDPAPHAKKAQGDDGVRKAVASAGLDAESTPAAMSLITQCLAAVHFSWSGNPDPLPAFCQLFGVDDKKIERETRASLDKRKKEPKPAKAVATGASPARSGKKPAKTAKGGLTPEGRKKLAAAMKKRWGARKAMTPAERAKIAAKQRARWAAARKGVDAAGAAK